MTVFCSMPNSTLFLKNNQGRKNSMKVRKMRFFLCAKQGLKIKTKIEEKTEKGSE